MAAPENLLFSFMAEYVIMVCTSITPVVLAAVILGTGADDALLAPLDEVEQGKKIFLCLHRRCKFCYFFSVHFYYKSGL